MMEPRSINAVLMALDVIPMREEVIDEEIRREKVNARSKKLAEKVVCWRSSRGGIEVASSISPRRIGKNNVLSEGVVG